MKKMKEMFNSDSWRNFLTGMGTLYDRIQHTNYKANALLTENQIVDLYSEGLAIKIIDKPIELIFNAGFKIKNDDNNWINATLEERGYYKELNKLFKWARAFGGSLLYIGIDDGETDLTIPIKENNINEILFIKAFDRFKVLTTTYNENITNKNYSKPEIISIQPSTGNVLPIHSSRCYIVDGKDTCDQIRIKNQNWGLSEFQGNYEALREIGTMYNTLSTILQNYTKDVVKMDNLFSLISAGREQDIIKKTLYLDLTKNATKREIIDGKDSMERLTTNLSGIIDLVHCFMYYCSAVSDMPISILFGREASGLNATGENEIRTWLDSVASKRPFIISPVLERLTKLLMLEKQGYFKGVELPEWFIEYNSLYELTDKEKAEIYNITSQGDNNYITNQVLTPEQVSNRFKGNKFNLNLSI
jgi:phage-related protein (TIGR01555 family)